MSNVECRMLRIHIALLSEGVVARSGFYKPGPPAEGVHELRVEIIEYDKLPTPMAKFRFNEFSH